MILLGTDIEAAYPGNTLGNAVQTSSCRIHKKGVICHGTVSREWFVTEKLLSGCDGQSDVVPPRISRPCNVGHRPQA